MFKFHITEIHSIQISLAIIFIALGVIAAIINFNFQIASDQREQTLRLTKAIHDSDVQNDNETKELVDRTLQKIDMISSDQKNSSKALIDLILENQKIIKNTTGTNLNQTFTNRNTIHRLATEIDSFNLSSVKQLQKHDSDTVNRIEQDLVKLLNATRQ